MLRIHFTPDDLAQVTLAASPDPLWEIATSLHRLQSSRGRWAYAAWHHEARRALAGTPLGGAVRRILAPLLPRAAYFPDFLTPAESANGLAAGLDAIVDTPAPRVAHEVRKLDRVHGAPSWAGRLVERGAREEVAEALRAYHDAVIAPFHDEICAAVTGERALRGRLSMDAGLDGLLDSLSPAIRWRPPVLEVDYVEHRDLHLAGRGLRIVPSYFCWRSPVALADADLRPVLVYPLHPRRADAERPADVSLAALLGRTRAAALRVLALGATTSELARTLGVSPATATHHTTVLRDAGLVATRRSHNTVLHTLTPLGAALLAPGTPGVPKAPGTPNSVV